MTYVKVATIDDLGDGELQRQDIEGTGILLVRLGNTVRAYEDRHATRGDLPRQGQVDGHVLTYDGDRFDVRTGAGMDVTRRLRRVPVHLECGAIFIALEREVLPDREAYGDAPEGPDASDASAANDACQARDEKRARGT